MAGGGIKINNTKIIGGADGATFIPSVSENGDLSWSNNKGYNNPQTVNIKGKDGADGKDGKTGAKIVSQIFAGNDSDGGNIYKQTFDDGTEAYFTAPKGEKGEKGDIAKTPIVLGKMEEVEGVKYFYMLIPNSNAFSTVAINPVVGVVYYDVVNSVFYNYTGREYSVLIDFNENGSGGGGVDQALVDQVNANTENIATLTTEKVSKTDYATGDVAGIVRVRGDRGIRINTVGVAQALIELEPANDTDLTNRAWYKPITAGILDEAIVVGISTNTITLTEEKKTSALEWLGATEKFAPLHTPYIGNVRVWTSNGTSGYWEKVQSNDASAVNGNIPKYSPKDSGTSEYLGWLLTHTPVNDYQCANKKYVDDSIARWHSAPVVAFSWEGELATSQSATMDYVGAVPLLNYETLDIIIKLKSGAIVNKQIFPNSFLFADAIGEIYGFDWSFINDSQTISYKILQANSPTPQFKVINYSSTENSKIVRVDVVAYK